jgi:hypothetical protein
VEQIEREHLVVVRKKGIFNSLMGFSSISLARQMSGRRKKIEIQNIMGD